MVTAPTAAVLTEVVDAPAVTVPPLPVGGAVTVMVRVAGAPAPAAFDAISRTVYVPAAAKVCDGDRSVEVAPSPNSHAHDVGAPVEVSLNDTANGATPLTGDASNDDTGADGPGGASETVIVRVAGAPAPAAFDAISRTVYVPA
ncbi:hypothetical protein OF117_22055, partial [Geodermatophilus sp. YIM 151500]